MMSTRLSKFGTFEILVLIVGLAMVAGILADLVLLPALLLTFRPWRSEIPDSPDSVSGE